MDWGGVVVGWLGSCEPGKQLGLNDALTFDKLAAET